MTDDRAMARRWQGDGEKGVGCDGCGNQKGAGGDEQERTGIKKDEEDGQDSGQCAD